MKTGKSIGGKNTHSLILINLSDSSFESVRISVAQHSNTLKMILKKLSFDESKEVRKAAKDNRVIFNIKGNDFRLIVHIDYPRKIVRVKFIGTHAQYDKINAQEI